MSSQGMTVGVLHGTVYHMVMVVLAAMSITLTAASDRYVGTSGTSLKNSSGLAGEDINATIYYTSTDGFRLVLGKLDTAGAAYGILQNNSVNGWSTLNIKANPAGAGNNVTRSIQAMGELEAGLTCWHISLFSRNNNDINAGNNAKVAAFTEKTHAWTRHMAVSNASLYWKAVRGILAQFDGMVDGYAKHCSRHPFYQSLSQTQMLYMQMDGDLETLQSAYLEDQNVNVSRNTSRETHNIEGLRCSDLVKLAPDNSEVWFGHATWDTFSNLAPRIYKTYQYPLGALKGNGTQEYQTVGLSSSPSWISSIDDWYTTAGSSSLAVMETSHDINNGALYQKLKPETVLSWIRVMVANILAVDGESWATHFSYVASGTYTNEWQILDLNKFSKGQPPQNGFLTILEELPGLIHTEDMTNYLTEHRFWPSFNVPFFPSIQKEAGYSASDWSSDPRYCLLAELQNTVRDIESFEAVIRHNDFKHDKCSKHLPCTGAIACRADLGLAGQAFGALDAKWASSKSLARNLVYAQFGPTHDQQSPFCWNHFKFDPHHGHPECFEFETAGISTYQFEL